MKLTLPYHTQPNTARVVYSWNDNDPTTQDGSDAMRHTTRGSASVNLLGGLTNLPPDPSDTRSFTFRVNNVCMSVVCKYWFSLLPRLHPLKLGYEASNLMLL